MSGGLPPSGESFPSRKPGSDSFSIGAATASFEQLLDIEDYAQQVIGSRPLWRSLVQAIIDEVDPADAGSVSIVLANNPLVAIAGAAAIGAWSGRRVAVPMRAFERPPTPEMLARRLRQFGQGEPLQDWLTEARALSRPGDEARSVLIRAWGTSLEELASQLASTPAPLKAGLIATVQIADPNQAGAIADTTAWNLAASLFPIVARTIHALRLPTHQPCMSLDDARELLQRLLAANDVDGVLRQLNTPEHDSFDRAAWRLEGEQRPETSALFNEYVLAAGEDRPRHSASLYLVSHFGRISPTQLLAMGDVLARHTPAARPGADMPRAPAEVTDRVLKDCGIRVVGTEGTGSYALLGPRDGTGATEEPIQAAGRIRMLFQREAPLLTERYLMKLAQDVTMGCVSEGIAATYQELEMDALRLAAALDPAAACERLARIAFAHPTLTGLRAPEESERPGLGQSIERLTTRMPGFLEKVARTTRLSIDDAVGAICSASPATPDARLLALFRHSAACIFWGTYAARVPGMTLQAFPGLFEQSDEGSARRRDLVDSFRAALDVETPDPMLRRFAGLLVDAQLLARLLADVGMHFSDMRPEEGLNVTLLADVACNLLLASLPRRPWRDVTPGAAAADRPLVQALLSSDSQRWWGQPREQVTLPGTRSMQIKLQRLYGIARAVIEGLAASSSFNEFEKLSIDIWLVDALGVTQTAENIQAGYFHYGDAWLDALHEPGALGEAFYQAVQPLLKLFPLLVIMSATRTGSTPEGSPVFSFTEPLRQWLLGSGFSADGSPLQQLSTMLAEARRFQQAWRKAHDHWYLAVADRGRIVQAFKERVDALRAFERALNPLLEQSRRRPPSVRTQGSPSSPAAPTPPVTLQPE